MMMKFVPTGGQAMISSEARNKRPQVHPSFEFGKRWRMWRSKLKLSKVRGGSIITLTLGQRAIMVATVMRVAVARAAMERYKINLNEKMNRTTVTIANDSLVTESMR